MAVTEAQRDPCVHLQLAIVERPTGRVVGGAWADSLVYAFLAWDWARNSIRVVVDMELLPHDGA